MKDQKEEIRRLRDRCANTMELAMHLHGEPTLRQNALMISRCAASLEQWHMTWLADLRSRSDALRFNMGLVTGSTTLPCVNHIFSSFQDEPFLQQVGFTVEALASTNLCSSMQPDDPRLCAESGLAARMGRLAISLSQHRFGSLAQKMFSLPDMFVCLGHEDPAKREWAEGMQMRIDVAWQEVQPLSLPFWRAIETKCPMRMPLVQELMHALRANGYKASGDLIEVCQRVAKSFTTSAVTERGFQACRSVEAEYPDRRMTALEMWGKVVGDQMLSQAHGYTEVNHTSLPSAAPAKAALPPRMWKLNFKGQSLIFRSVVTSKKSAPYPTYSPKSMTMMHEGLQLMVYLSERGELGLGPSSWRTSLARPGSIVSWEGLPGKWMVFSSRWVAVALWPIVEVQVGSSTFFGSQPDVDCTHLRWVTMRAFTDCKVINFHFTCPLDICVHSGHKVASPLPAVFGRQVPGEPASVLVNAARFGFDGVPVYVIDKLLKLEWGCAIEGMIYAEKLLEAVQRAIGCTKAEAAEYLECRLTDALSSESIAEILQTPGVEDVVDPSDHQLLHDFCARAKDTTEEEADLKRVIREQRVAARAKGGGKGKGGKNRGKRAPVALPGDRSITLDEARAMVPPGCTLDRDGHQKRWQIFMGRCSHDGARWSKSCSWGVSGDERHTVEVALRAAWERYCSLHGGENPMDV